MTLWYENSRAKKDTRPIKQANYNNAFSVLSRERPAVHSHSLPDRPRYYSRGVPGNKEWKPQDFERFEVGLGPTTTYASLNVTPLRPRAPGSPHSIGIREGERKKKSGTETNRGEEGQFGLPLSV